MHHTIFADEVRDRPYNFDSQNVLVRAGHVAQEMGHQLVDPIHVLLAIQTRQYPTKLTLCLNETGLTAAVLDAQARATSQDQLIARSRRASQKMFFWSARLAKLRYDRTGLEAKILLSELSLSCLVSGSEALGNAVNERLNTTMHKVFASYEAWGRREDLASASFDQIHDAVRLQLSPAAVSLMF